MTEVKCPKCGKNFIPAPMHVYRTETRIFCSWTCYLHRNDKKNRGYHYKIVEQLTLDGELVREIKGTAEAAAIIDGSQNGIQQACREQKIYKGYLWRYKNEMSQMSK